MSVLNKKFHCEGHMDHLVWSWWLFHIVKLPQRIISYMYSFVIFNPIIDENKIM